MQKENIEFKDSLIPLSKVEKIIIHHTEEEDWDIYYTHKFHKETRKWSGIGYNFFIESGSLDGMVIEGRGFHIGAHASGYNSNSIGVCLSGNFDIHYPTEKQMDSLKKLCSFLIDKYHLSSKDILGHRELECVTKSCPGANFNLDLFRQQLNKEFLL
ncbi:N-acetylmuramoyl-L-alanine amidase [Bacillus sp. Soil745]|nr:N-acetylmuramoyl-L-alanine amidase [Bacillus sp. Soil745]